MKHLLTRPLDDDLVMTYYLSNDEQNNLHVEDYEIFLVRTVIGVCQAENEAFAVVMGERQIGDEALVSLFIALEDVLVTPPSEIADAVIALKDRYMATTVWAQEGFIYDNLYRQEGLTHYDDQSGHVQRQRWPSYTSRELKAKVKILEMPVDEKVHRDINDALALQVRDPDTGVAMEDKWSATPIHELLLPGDFPTSVIRTALRQGQTDYVRALWLALMGMKRLRHRQKISVAPKERRGNPITGY